MPWGDERSERGCLSLAIIILEKGSRRCYYEIMGAKTAFVRFLHSMTPNKQTALLVPGNRRASPVIPRNYYFKEFGKAY